MFSYEPGHSISYNIVYMPSKVSDPPAHPHSDQSLHCQPEDTLDSCLLRPSQGGTYSLVSLNISAFSLVPQNQNLNVLCSLLPKITFVPLFPSSFRLVFPCSPEINDIIPLFHITPGRASLLTECPAKIPDYLDVQADVSVLGSYAVL